MYYPDTKRETIHLYGPVQVIEDEEVPLMNAKDEGNWALINFVCFLATMLLAILLLGSKRCKYEGTTAAKRSWKNRILAGELLSYPYSCLHL